MRPLHTRFGVSTRTAAVVFRVTRRFFTRRQIPVLPALRADHFRHLCVQIDDVGKISPGPAEICFHLRLAVDLAVRENEPEWLIIISRRGGDISVLQAMYVTALEPHR